MKGIHEQLQLQRDLTERKGWRDVVLGAVESGVPPFAPDEFDTYWIEGGHRIREQVGDDAALTAFLRLCLPPFVRRAGAPLELYRGENIDRLRAGRLGFAWTPSRDTAEMFASGLNAAGTGGVLLRASLADEIIAGPCEHSTYLDEEQYTVDPTAPFSVEQVKEFPAFE